MRRRTRREFSKLTAAGIVAAGIGCATDDGDGTDDGAGSSEGGGSSTSSTSAGTSSSATTAADGSGSDGSSGAADSSSGAGTDSASGGADGSTGTFDCEPSPPSIEGPFYRPGIPIRTDLDLYGDPGIPLHMSGRVYDTSCSPVANAVVEIWHATPVTPAGDPGDVDATYDATREYRYYGQTATDAEGNYHFDTLQPGWYLNGAEYRPAHIHLKIWTRNVQRLVTQLYFPDDPFNAGDPWFDATMVLVADQNGNATMDFTI
jgi:protocatechuate 3,4-dioxygenase beta subunit